MRGGEVKTRERKHRQTGGRIKAKLIEPFTVEKKKMFYNISQGAKTRGREKNSNVKEKCEPGPFQVNGKRRDSQESYKRFADPQ